MAFLRKKTGESQNGDLDEESGLIPGGAAVILLPCLWIAIIACEDFAYDHNDF